MFKLLFTEHIKRVHFLLLQLFLKLNIRNKVLIELKNGIETRPIVSEI